MYKIKIIPAEEFSMLLPFLQMLNEKVSPGVLKLRVEAMKQPNYQCVGIFDRDQLVGISGIWLLVKHDVGKHIEPDNVIIHPDHRKKKAGEMLMLWIHDYAKNNECVVSELNCYLGNTSAHKFWLNLGYEIIAFHMRKKL